ncbi:hypothetical protein CLU79DRAFT_761989 [Phycomyces nitens]|nr:hypothetical protein CLU79DRAFT_761989 [Phycomyces nitens]
MDANHCMKLALKDHLCQVLASTSVLLLTRHTFPNDVQPFLKHEKWTAASTAIENIYKIRQPPIPINTVASLLSPTTVKEQKKSFTKQLSRSLTSFHLCRLMKILMNARLDE